MSAYGSSACVEDVAAKVRRDCASYFAGMRAAHSRSGSRIARAFLRAPSVHRVSRHVYFPAAPTEQAQADVLDHVVRTYFAGSAEQAMTALLRMSDASLTEAELQVASQDQRRMQEREVTAHSLPRGRCPRSGTHALFRRCERR